MALGVLKALKDSGLAVPAQVSVVGFDDTPEAAFYDPPLTTVVQDFGLLGRRSLEELLRLIGQPQDRYRHFVFQPQLVLRGSSGPAQHSVEANGGLPAIPVLAGADRTDPPNRAKVARKAQPSKGRSRATSAG